MYDLIIIGGGAAGLFLAANIKNKKVLLLEKMKVPGKKILISGGGMCNLTNCDSTEEFITNFGDRNKANFLKPALMNLSAENTVKWFESHGLALTIREDGKIFPKSLKAQSLVDCLKKISRDNKVEIKTSHNVISVVGKEGQFSVKTDKEVYNSHSLVIATGGKSFESTGSDGSGYALAKTFGHRIVEPTQALVAANIENYHYSALAGNSIRMASVDFFRNGEDKRYLHARGDLLFTHKGISGPVILNNSRYIRTKDLIRASLISTENRETSRNDLSKAFSEDPRVTLGTLLKAQGLFSSLIDAVLGEVDLKRDLKCGNLNKTDKNKLLSILLDCPFSVARKGSFSTAMVTAGGVDLDDINRKTMESKIKEGLFFAGEVLDLDGNTGGYNIQAAFSTAYLIALTLNKLDR